MANFETNIFDLGRRERRTPHANRIVTWHYVRESVKALCIRADFAGDACPLVEQTDLSAGNGCSLWIGYGTVERRSWKLCGGGQDENCYQTQTQ